MRGLLFIIGVSIGTSAFADRLITIPLGRKVPFQNIKFDTFVEVGSARTWDRYIAFGLSPEYEIAYHGERIGGGDSNDTFDLSYNFVAPIMNQSPGISFGVTDVLNQTRDGRTFYGAVTYRLPADEIGFGNVPLELTLGLGQGRVLKPFVGASFPLTERFRFLAENNGYRFAIGWEYRPNRAPYSARLIVRDRDVMLGANLTLRF